MPYYSTKTTVRVRLWTEIKPRQLQEASNETKLNFVLCEISGRGVYVYVEPRVWLVPYINHREQSKLN